MVKEEEGCFCPPLHTQRYLYPPQTSHGNVESQWMDQGKTKKKFMGIQKVF